MLGFTGMVAELTLLAAFQLSSGSLYQSIAGLVGLFMAGLAAGSALGLQVRRGARVQPRAPARCFGHRAGGPPVGRSPAILPAAAVSAGLLIALIGALLGRRILSAPPIPFLLCVSIAMTLAGASCGAGVSFVLSDTSLASAQRKSLGWGGLVYGADLFGGALGGLLASGLAIPLLGIARSFWLAVLGYGMSLLLLAAQRIGARGPA